MLSPVHGTQQEEIPGDEHFVICSTCTHGYQETGCEQKNTTYLLNSPYLENPWELLNENYLLYDVRIDFKFMPKNCHFHF